MKVILGMCARMYAGLHVKCSSLLLNFNHNCNVVTNFSKTQYQFSWKSVQQFSRCYKWTDKYGEALFDLFVVNMQKKKGGGGDVAYNTLFFNQILMHPG
jgi:hypothetical protein